MKTRLILLLFIIPIFTNSCKKSWTCDCSFEYTWTDGETYVYEDNFDILKAKKKEAKQICSDYETEQSSSWQYEYSCDLNKLSDF
jgi:hypothetical protein